MKRLKGKAGECPYCGSNNIHYGKIVPLDDDIYYKAKCNDCGREYKEYYSLNFEGNWGE